ncbi:hypothetical protein KSS87_015510 [Heliosperma pusillum]|nr:hypothetical protein KSS87_015510 [Heliosperma pusillum]
MFITGVMSITTQSTNSISIIWSSTVHKKYHTTWNFSILFLGNTLTQVFTQRYTSIIGSSIKYNIKAVKIFQHFFHIMRLT